MEHVKTLVDLFFAMGWSGVALLIAVMLATGLALTGHGSDADWLDHPREDWRAP